MSPVFDPGALFAALLLVAGFFAGGVALFIAGWLAVQKLWQHFHYKSELEQEQAFAVAVAEAHVRQHFHDRRRDNGSGQGASV